MGYVTFYSEISRTENRTIHPLPFSVIDWVFCVVFFFFVFCFFGFFLEMEETEGESTETNQTKGSVIKKRPSLV